VKGVAKEGVTWVGTLNEGGVDVGGFFDRLGVSVCVGAG
jgi:hypothetical protein